MIGALLPFILQGFAASAAGVAGDIAARSVWDKISKDPKASAQVPSIFTRWLQASLKVVGHEVDVDGQFGPQTEAALKKFQAAHDLLNDGIAGPKTLDALATTLAALPRPAVTGHRPTIEE